MQQQIIGVGVDLGTTNSSIAINREGVVEIIKKPGGLEYTPSVFGFDKAKNKIVGQKAYDALYKNVADDLTDSVRPEIKRIIGTPEVIHFERAGVDMSAEEISAEILKSLRADVARKYPDFDTTSVVITIPAAFSILQCEATKRAGNLAGFTNVELLQEPIAAAIAYGFGNTSNETWLIYDLGGGTFDVAVVAAREGVLSVIAHRGDNFLGGKNIDWEVVEKIFLPELRSKFELKDFARSNPAEKVRFGKLKYLAERAKIELSSYDTTLVEFEGLGADIAGRPLEHGFSIDRAMVEQVMEPVVNRTVELCLEALQDAGIAKEAVDKVVLVGGPTQSTYIQSKLESALGIRTDATVDPLTVVARGACIFGMSRPVAAPVPIDGSPAGVRLALYYEALTVEPEQIITGEFQGINPDQSLSVQIQSEDGSFVSNLVPLKRSKFLIKLPVPPNKTSRYWIYLTDSEDNAVAFEPDVFSITHGLAVAGAPLPHSIGVCVLETSLSSRGAAQREVFDRLIEKGSTLPAKATASYRTARPLSTKSRNNPLWIRVGEGESNIPDRNAFVCALGIEGSSLPKDLPAGTELQITIAVSAIRELAVAAHFPSIDLTVNARATVQDELIDISDVEKDFDGELGRASTLTNLSAQQSAQVGAAANAVSDSLRNAHVDEDEKRKASKQLREFKSLLDGMEKQAELPDLAAEFAELLDRARDAIAYVPDAGERAKYERQLEDARIEGEGAVTRADKSRLQAVSERLGELIGRAIQANPATWVQHFEWLCSNEFKDLHQARTLMNSGQKAINENNLEELMRCCRALSALLPRGALAAPNAVSGITR